MTYGEEDFKISHTLHGIQSICAHCGEEGLAEYVIDRVDQSQTEHKSCDVIKHSQNCVLMRAANRAAESKQ